MASPVRQKAFITGASVGIGRAVAVALASNGYYVALNARSSEGLGDTLEQVRSLGGDGKIYTADLRNVGELRKLAEDIATDIGALDVIANIAGVWHDDAKAFQGPLLHQTPEEEILQVLDVGIRAPMILARLLLPSMVDRRTGHIINLSGTFADGAKGWLHYYVSKKALEAFTIGLAQELRDYEIQVNCVSPADVATPPYQRFYPEYAASALQPDDVAEVVLNLLSPGCRHITGQIIEIRNKHDHG